MNTVEYWRSLNSPGYEVHAAAVALRQEMRDASKNINDDLNALLRSAREFYPRRTALRARSTSPASDIKPGKLETSVNRVRLTDHIAQVIKPAQVYSIAEERAALKDLLLAQRHRSDFAPWSYNWWKRFEPLVCYH